MRFIWRGGHGEPAVQAFPVLGQLGKLKFYSSLLFHRFDLDELHSIGQRAHWLPDRHHFRGLVSCVRSVLVLPLKHLDKRLFPILGGALEYSHGFGRDKASTVERRPVPAQYLLALIFLALSDSINAKHADRLRHSLSISFP